MDASDAIALTSVISGSVVALGGLAAGYISGARDRTHAVELAERDRQQARLDGTYVELLTYAQEVGIWAQSIVPPKGGDPNRPTAGLPEMPDSKTEASVLAKTAAFASDEVKAALDVWHQALQELRAKVPLVQLRWSHAERFPGTIALEDADWTTPWSELEMEARPAEQKAREGLQRVVAQELRHPADRRERAARGMRSGLHAWRAIHHGKSRRPREEWLPAESSAPA